MKKIKISIAILLATLSLSSCVSSKKYKEATAQGQNTEQRLNNLQADYDKLKSENQNLQSSLASSKNDLQNKDASIADEQKKLQDLRALVDAERNAIKNLKQEVCSALKCFSPDELSIEIRDGKLYVSL